MAPPLPPPGPSPTLAEAFLERLAAEPPPSPRPMPPALAPLAAVVAGTTDVRIATGPAVRRALGDVGKQAATVGSTIHLAHTPADRPGDLAILGHELAHVAARGREPRFHGGRRDAEERHAEQVGSAVRDAAARGTSGLRVGGASLAGRTVHLMVQRAVDEALRRRPAPESAEAPPAPAHATQPQVVQLAPPPPAEPDVVVRRAPAIQRAGDDLSPADGGIDLDRIVEALEERVLSELERRGGRLVEVI